MEGTSAATGRKLTFPRRRAGVALPEVEGGKGRRTERGKGGGKEGESGLIIAPLRSPLPPRLEKLFPFFTSPLQLFSSPVEIKLT